MTKVLYLASKKEQCKVLRVKRVDSEVGLLGLNSSSTLSKLLNLSMPQFLVFNFLKSVNQESWKMPGKMQKSHVVSTVS